MDLENVNTRSRLPVPFDSGLLYSIAAVYYVYISQILMRFNFRDDINLVLSQILFFAVPPFLLAIVRRYDIKKTFRLKAPKPLEVLIMLVISPVMVVAGFCAGFIALLSIKSVFGRVYLPGQISDFMNNGILISLLLIAVLPAVCEEILFRGMIQRGMERLGAGWSIFLSGLVFGLFHFDFQRLAAQTFIGFIAAYAVYRTGSIFNGMILHFMNNGLLTLLSSLSLKGASEMGGEVVTDPFSTPQFLDLAKEYNMSLEQLLSIMTVVLSLVFVFSVVVIFGLLIILRTITKNTVEKPDTIKGSAKGLLAGLPGILLIVVVYTSLGLILLNNPLGKQLLQLLGIARG